VMGGALLEQFLCAGCGIIAEQLFTPSRPL
jgi:hypothetical protein